MLILSKKKRECTTIEFNCKTVMKSLAIKSCATASSSISCHRITSQNASPLRMTFGLCRHKSRRKYMDHDKRVESSVKDKSSRLVPWPWRPPCHQPPHRHPRLLNGASCTNERTTTAPPMGYGRRRLPHRPIRQKNYFPWKKCMKPSMFHDGRNNRNNSSHLCSYWSRSSNDNRPSFLRAGFERHRPFLMTHRLLL